MHSVRNLILLLSLSLMPQTISAQQIDRGDREFSLSADLVSRYVWRGMACNNSPAIQPSGSFSARGFTAGTWGSFNLNMKGDRETDFYLSGELGSFSFAIWDYWTFCDTAKPHFFDYNKKTGMHSLETQVIFETGDVIPVSLLAGYFLYGNDAAGSLYLESNCTFKLGGTNMILTAGFQAMGKYYAENPGFVNLGLNLNRPVRITKKWNMPVSMSVILNPASGKCFMVAGITLQK